MQDTLYYDGRCALCAREIAHLQRWKDEHLALVDIHALNDTDGLPTKQQLLEVLHLQRGDSWLTGADASVAAWQHTRFGALWRWLRWPLIAPLVDAVYARWARWRYRRLYGGACNGSDLCS